MLQGKDLDFKISEIAANFSGNEQPGWLGTSELIE